MNKGQKQTLIALGAVAAIVVLVLVVFPAIPGGFLSGAAYGNTQQEEVDDGGPDCGKNPYKFNDIEGQYERTFDKACFDVTHDQNEIDLDGQYWTGE